MVRRPTMDEVRPVADLFLAASADQVPGERAVKAARLLGGGTREGQTHVNLLLARIFAEILEAECPAEWRTMWGVPNVVKLIGMGDENNLEERYVAAKAGKGLPVAHADAKARIAAAENAAVLAQQYLKVLMKAPDEIAEFTAAAEDATGLMIDHVWGALWMACAKARELT
ncbi:hypothetical protein ABZ612_20425 [Streptomyces avermitilis]|uniref:hypothetical protein n=1 Tax=Streptomyces avermitilis TaxID=33903 RepID=UPI0033D89D28